MNSSLRVQRWFWICSLACAALLGLTSIAGCTAATSSHDGSVATAGEHEAEGAGGEHEAGEAGSEHEVEVDARDLASYTGAMNDLGQREAGLVERYSSVTGGNYTDDAAIKDVLSELLPDVQEYVEDVEAVVPPEGPIAEAHELYVEAWKTQADGMTLVLSALEGQDSSLIAEANEKLAEARTLMEEAHAELTAAVGSE